MNERKVGNILSSTHRKAVIPSRPHRHYKVSLVALSNDEYYQDSARSNTLFISTGDKPGCLPRSGSVTSIDLEDWYHETIDDKDLPVKVIKTTDTSIHLDWYDYLEPEDLGHYRIQWSSVAQPTVRCFIHYFIA